MAKPIVAIVGRPNVGKSTLFNRIAEKRVSIVDDAPGVTRDRIYADAEWTGHQFALVDTGGIDFSDTDELLPAMRNQAKLAMEEADVILFGVDGKVGITDVDQAIALKFEPVHHAAARGEYDGWAASAEGALALLILLDQFPRNLYRGSAHAFATDPKARATAAAAVARGHDREVEPLLRRFFYLPFEHGEDLADQRGDVVAFVEHRDDDGKLGWGHGVAGKRKERVDQAASPK